MAALHAAPQIDATDGCICRGGEADFQDGVAEGSEGVPGYVAV